MTPTMLHYLREMVVQYSIPEYTAPMPSGPTDYLDQDHEVVLGHGMDEHGRFFMSLPVQTQEGKVVPLVIFQRYTDSEQIITWGTPSGVSEGFLPCREMAMDELGQIDLLLQNGEVEVNGNPFTLHAA